MNIFQPADILLPNVADLSRWAVIACDQFTSDPAYWQRVRAEVGEAPSALRLILPEAELGLPGEEARIAEIHRTMELYRRAGLLETYAHAFVYVERSLQSGAIRKGLVGMIDLEAYDFSEDARSPIRATEKTVVERIPPRMKVRRGACLELPHVLLLCDDHQKQLLEPIEARKDRLPLLYDFDLLEDGGHITGWLVEGAEAADFEARLTAYAHGAPAKYQDLEGAPMLFAVGDGNHSLATAKTAYEELKKAHPGEDLSGHPARYALVELENIHDSAQVFEPIHRIVLHTRPEELLRDLEKEACAQGGYPVKWFIGTQSGTIFLDRRLHQLPVGALQAWLDRWLRTHPGTVDYIHDDDALQTLAREPEAIGFLLPAMEKRQLFRSVIANGTLPRKTFSLGHARDKRYYLEGRAIL